MSKESIEGYCSFKNDEEFIEEYCRRFYYGCGLKRVPFSLPIIWVRCKADKTKRMVDAYSENSLILASYEINFKAALKIVTFLDGFSCGIKEGSNA